MPFDLTRLASVAFVRMANISVYADILSAAAAAVTAAVTGEIAAASVVVRRRPEYRKGHDAMPLVVISPEAERIDPGDLQFGGTCFVRYPVNVTLIANSALVLNSPTFMFARREEIRQSLHVATLGGAATVFDVASYDPAPAYDLSGFDQTFDVSRQTFTYLSAEERTA